MQLFRRNKDTASSVGAAAAQQAISASDQLGRMIDQGSEQASAALANVKEQSQQAAETANEALSDLRSTIETSVRAQPITALFITAIAGIAIGVLMRSGNGR
jgi:hypothetical protein